MKKIIFTLSLLLSSTLWAQGMSSDLTSRMTPAKHQGYRNTCSVFAATALMEFLIKEETGETLDLSENYNYWLAKKKWLHNEYLVNSYEKIDGHAGYLAVESYQFGSMLESEWPYEYYNWYQTSDSRCDKNNITTECYTGVIPNEAETLGYKMKAEYVQFEEIISFLKNEERPVIVNIMWYINSVDENGDMRMPTESDMAGPQGGHVIVLVGYDEENHRFIFKNSHGTDFGRDGFGTMPVDYLFEHYEVKPWMDSIDQVGPGVRELLTKGSHGVSATLEMNF